MEFDQNAIVLSFPLNSAVRIMTDGESSEILDTSVRTNAILERSKNSMSIHCGSQFYDIPRKMKEQKIRSLSTEFKFIDKRYSPYSVAGKLAVQALSENDVYTFSDEKLTDTLILTNNLAGFIPLEKFAKGFKVVHEKLTAFWEPFGNFFSALGWLWRNIIWVIVGIAGVFFVAIIISIIK